MAAFRHTHGCYWHVYVERARATLGTKSLPMVPAAKSRWASRMERETLAAQNITGGTRGAVPGRMLWLLPPILGDQ